MTTNLDPHSINDSVLFRVSTYDTDGVTLITASSCVCSVWSDADTAIITAQAGTVAAGYAQYNWSGTSTAGRYRGVLTVTLSAGVIQSEEFYVTIAAKPPAYTTDPDTEIGEVRMELGDDVQGDGVRPDGSNLTDAQIQVLLDREGSVMRAVAAACELLARQWTRVANISIGPRSEQLGVVSEQWAKRGEKLRAQYGGGGSGAFAIAPGRVDGYSSASDGDDVGSEYAE